MVLCPPPPFDGARLKFKKKKQAGLQFTSMDYLSLVLTSPRNRHTIPLMNQSNQQCCGAGARMSKLKFRSRLRVSLSSK
jgi:predicted transcriptional regulator